MQMKNIRKFLTLGIIFTLGVVIFWLLLSQHSFRIFSRNYTPLKSPDGSLTLVPSVSGEGIVCFEVKGPEGNSIFSARSGASDFHRWSLNWDGKDAIVLNSSDIGLRRWIRNSKGSWKLEGEESWAVYKYQRHLDDGTTAQDEIGRYPNRTVSYKRTYRNGEKDGQWFVYNYDGKLISVTQYQNGQEVPLGPLEVQYWIHSEIDEASAPASGGNTNQENNSSLPAGSPAPK